ncbi:MAG: HDOD domain-containing protein [Pseudomonadales bacterium]
MAIPHCVLSSLNAKQINYEIIEADLPSSIAEQHQQKTTDQQIAVMVLLETADTKLQAIVSSTSILNLDALNDFTGQYVQPVSCKSNQELLVAKGLKTLPAVPDITIYKTFVDEALLGAKTILMSSGQQDTLLSLSQNDFALLIDDCHTMPLGIAIAGFAQQNHDRSNDSKDIDNAIRNYTSLQIKKRLSDTLEIPPLSATAQKILNLSSDPNADIDQLVKIIELDPSLAAQVVSWAASPYYSAPGKIASIRDAIVRVLGFELVMNLALGLAMGQSLTVPKNGACGIALFWRQAIYSALAMEKINRIVPASKRGQAGYAYLAGLMNNFGYLILNHVFPAHFATLCLYMNASPHINPMYIEQHLLGVTSEQMCSQLAEAWNLPLQINNALRFQQDPLYTDEDANYANLCFVTTRLLTRMDIGNLPYEDIPASLYEALELNPDDAENIMLEMQTSKDEIEMMLSSLAA